MKKILIVVLVLALLMVGCSSEVDPLLGSWYDESTGQMITFEDDGTLSFGGVKADYIVEENLITMTVGDNEDVLEFTIEGDSLELKFPDADDYELYFTKVQKAN